MCILCCADKIKLLSCVSLMIHLGNKSDSDSRSTLRFDKVLWKAQEAGSNMIAKCLHLKICDCVIMSF